MEKIKRFFARVLAYYRGYICPVCYHTDRKCVFCRKIARKDRKQAIEIASTWKPLNSFQGIPMTEEQKDYMESVLPRKSVKADMSEFKQNNGE